MTIHQSDPNRAADSDFLPGELAFLVPGNACRLLDGRRTPGIIEDYFPESAMFRFRIGAFEDKGKYWDLPAEQYTRYQFAKDSTRHSAIVAREMRAAVDRFQQPLEIKPGLAARQQTEADITIRQSEVEDWLKTHSGFFALQTVLDLDDRLGPPSLAEDLSAFMKIAYLAEIETRTAETIVLNPNSREWVKGMLIVLAEMGLLHYRGTISRTADIWDGTGMKATRQNYLIHRLAFVRAYFSLLSVQEVAVYRGMSTETDWFDKSRMMLHCTFNLEVAQSFSDLDREGQSRHAYLVKRTFPVGQLFMTYLETAAMNRQFKEAEAIVLVQPEDNLWW
jgi:hypothetical protein